MFTASSGRKREGRRRGGYYQQGIAGIARFVIAGLLLTAVVTPTAALILQDTTTSSRSTAKKDTNQYKNANAAVIGASTHDRSHDEPPDDANTNTRRRDLRHGSASSVKQDNNNEDDGDDEPFVDESEDGSFSEGAVEDSGDPDNLEQPPTQTNYGDESMEDDVGRTGFSIIAVGPYGGIDQSFVTSFLLQGVTSSSSSRSRFVSLDAGTTVSGIQAAVNAGSFQDILEQDEDYMAIYSQNLTDTGYIFLHGVQAYLLTHPHQDHNIGLTIAATDDLSSSGEKKQVFGTEFTTSTLQTDVWNWRTWPNFGSSGISPLNTYDVVTVQADGRTVYECPPTTQLTFQAFPLLHGSYPTAAETTGDDGEDGTSIQWLPYPSTAYLMQYNRLLDDNTDNINGNNNIKYNPKVLFFGDTGADQISNTTHLRDIWESVAIDVADGTLHAILLECSYTDAQPDNLLFGHLKPKLFVQEMVVLRDLVVAQQQKGQQQNNSLRIDGSQSTAAARQEQDQAIAAANEALSQVKIIVQHIKPSSSLFKSKTTTGDVVMEELQEWSQIEGLELDFIQPMPGQRYDTY